MMGKQHGFVLLLCTVLFVITQHPCKGAKILMIPSVHYSHMNFFAKYGAGLQQEGHSVSLLIPPIHRSTVEKHGLTAVTLHSDEFDSTEKVAAKYGLDPNKANSFLTNFLTLIRASTEYSTSYCSTIMEDENLMATLSSADYDLVISDGVIFFRCLYIVPYKLNKPYLTLSAWLDPWNSGVFSSPAVEPVQLIPLTNSLGFFNRLKNFAASVAIKLADLYMTDGTLLEKYVPEGNASGYRELYQRSEMWLINFDQWCIDYPRVSAPHYQFIGGSSGQPPAPLTEDIKTFVEEAQHGIIVLSFGSLSMLSKWSPEKARTFMDAFRKLKQRVVIRYNGEPIKDAPDNVLISEWLPQNDLLGHEKTVLFITHGGNNGQLESVYHGVPMLAFPVAGDQVYNTQRMIHHGYGKQLDFETFTSDELAQTINIIIENGEYKQRIQRCSDILKSFPSPNEKFNFWVNHVLKFGGQHLRPVNFELSMPELFLWDIVLFLLVIVHVAIALCLWICCCCLRKCCRSNATKVKHE